MLQSTRLSALSFLSILTFVIANMPATSGQQVQSRFWPIKERRKLTVTTDPLPTEKLDGEGIWVDPALSKGQRPSRPVTVWFEDQFLGDGKAFARRSKEFQEHKRRELSQQVVATLKTLAEKSYQAAEQDMRGLVEKKQVGLVQWHWIVNGFSCVATDEGIESLKTIPGVKKIFQGQPLQLRPANDQRKPQVFAATDRSDFDPDQYLHPWYGRSLMAEKVWRELKVSGQGTLNVVMDFQFIFSPSVTANLYRNPNEIPGNDKDDDGNGLIDDYHGFNFGRGDAVLNTKAATGVMTSRDLHGFMCAAEICGTGSKQSRYEFGLAPSATWAGVIGSGSPEAPIQWAIEQQAGLKPGDLIRAIDGAPVVQPTDIGKATNVARSKDAKTMEFSIERNGKAMKLSVPVPEQVPLGLRVLKSESYNQPVFE